MERGINDRMRGKRRTTKKKERRKKRRVKEKQTNKEIGRTSEEKEKR